MRRGFVRGPIRAPQGKVDMSCVYPGGGMRPNPPPLPALAGESLVSFPRLQQENDGVPQYHTAAPLLPAEGAMRKGQQMPSWNSKKALGYSTISRAASSTNLDLEQSTVTWRRYLCLRFSWVSLPSESRCLSSAIVPAPVLPCKAKKGAGHPPRARRRESLTVCCLRTVIIVPRPPRSGQRPQLMQSCRHQASSGCKGTGTRGKMRQLLYAREKIMPPSLTLLRSTIW